MRHSVSLLVLLAACDHSAPFTPAPILPLGPKDATPPVHLTFNPATDYAPTWTEDGKGILYNFAQQNRSDGDRCLGLLPADGGTRLWTLCDDRATHADSSDSFGAAALGTDGRLLYLESSARKGKEAPDNTVLWLADTAAPFNRRALITFPSFVGDSIISWMSDVQWTGPNEFIALAQRLEVFQLFLRRIESDTVLWGQAVVRGTISATGAALRIIPGTEGFAWYALAEGGNTIVLARRYGLSLQRVPISGGIPTLVADIPPDSNRHILGLTCRGETCLVAADLVLLRPPAPLIGTEPQPNGRVFSVNLTTGAVDVLQAAAASVFLAGPHVAPGLGDIVLQVGALRSTDLYLYKGMLP